MTFADLKALVSYTLDDLNFGYFTQTQVGLWLNNAQRETQKRLLKAGQNFYAQTVKTTTVVNQRDYIIPADYKKLHRLDLIISGTCPNESVIALTPITWNEQDMVASGVGTPSCYTLRKTRLSLFPAPDTALTMRLTYSPLVADMTLDTDIPDVPDSYQELLALLAAQDGFIKDGRVPDLLVKKIKDYEEDMDSDANERRQDLSREVRPVSDFGGGDMYW